MIILIVRLSQNNLTFMKAIVTLKASQYPLIKLCVRKQTNLLSPAIFYCLTEPRVVFEAILVFQQKMESL